MFCSGCGFQLANGQPACPQCGRPVAPPIPPIPNIEMQVAGYASRIRALSIVWFVYGGLGLLLSAFGMMFAKTMMLGGFPWMHGHMGHDPFWPDFIGPAFFHMIWVLLVLRSALAFAAGWGLMNHAPWGRVVAIVAAFFNILKIPFGTALGIWTLVTLLGYRNATLYAQLPPRVP